MAGQGGWSRDSGLPEVLGEGAPRKGPGDQRNRGVGATLSQGGLGPDSSRGPTAHSTGKVHTDLLWGRHRAQKVVGTVRVKISSLRLRVLGAGPSRPRWLLGVVCLPTFILVPGRWASVE